MRKPPLPYLLFVLIVLATFYSCVPQKKIPSTKDKLTVVDSQLQQYGKDLKVLDERQKNKQSQNEIDEPASSRLHQFITKTSAEIDSLVARNSILIGETVIDRSDWVRLTKSLSATQKKSNIIGEKILLITDLVNRNTVINLDQDVLFEPGQYIVTPAVAAAIGNFFEPASREIDLFVKKYPDFPFSLVITANGYADATVIGEGTSLYKELKTRLKLNAREPDSKELNKELSRARAEEVIALFKKFTAGRSENGSNIKNIIYVFEGKGESLPNPKTTDYKVDDRRRRIVLLYWSVFPE